MMLLSLLSLGSVPFFVACRRSFPVFSNARVSVLPNLYCFTRRKTGVKHRGHVEQGLHFLGNNTFTLLFLNPLARAEGALLCILGPMGKEQGGCLCFLDVGAQH